MIYKSGKEIKEIYIGNTPVSSVYIGNQLVWRSYTYFKTDSTSLYIPLSDAEVLKTHGITYSICDAAALPIVSVSPYMRYIAPMLVCSFEVGTTSAVPNIFGTKLTGEIVNFLPISVADITKYAGSVGKAEGAFSAVNSATNHDGRGDITRQSHIIASHQKTPMSEALGKLNGIRYISGWAYKVCGMDAHGSLDNGDGVLIALYKIAAMYGAADKYTAHFLSGLTALPDAASSKASSRHFECISQSPQAAITELKIRKTDITYSSTEAEPITSLSRVYIMSGVSKTTETDYSILPNAHISLTPGAGKAKNTSHAALGLSLASMTTEIYTEPAHSDFDSTAVIDTDGLDVWNIDTMKIKI